MRTPPGLLCLLALAAPMSLFAAQVYYADQPTGSPGSIRKVGLDGNAPGIVITYPGLPNLRGIAFHRASGRIYILDNAAKVIRSVFPNGSSQIDVTPIDPSLLGSDLEVDESGSKIFWSETRTGATGDGFIRSANLDGTGLATAVSAGPGSESPYFIHLDRAGGFIYWGALEATSSQNNPTSFRRASFAGVIDPTFAIVTPTRSRDIAVDPTTSIAYWADRQTGAIYRRLLAGGFNETVISGMNAPHGVAIDVQARKVYWADTGQRGSGGGASSRRVARCNFDGTELDILTPTDGFNEPWDLALDLRSPTFADWRSRFFSSTTPLRSPLDDADGDGDENVLEYAFDSNPRDGTAMNTPTATAKGLTYSRRRVSTLTYRVEVSTDLANWRYNGDGSGQIWTTEDSVTPIDEEMDAVVIEPVAALASAAQLHYRVHVSTSETIAAPLFKTLKQQPRRSPLRRK